MLFKKSVSPVVASLLMVTVAIVVGVYVFNWYSDYTSGVTRDISEKQYSKDIRTDYVGKNILYGYNEYNNFKPDKVLIDGNECEILNSDDEFSKGTFEIQFDESCSQGLTSSMNEILIITDKGSYKSLLSVSDATYTYGDNSGGGGDDDGEEETSYCSSGNVTHNSIIFSHGTIEDTKSPKLSKTTTIEGGTEKHYITIRCSYPNVEKDENSYYSEITCNSDYEKNTEETACIETTTDQTYCPAQSSYTHNGIIFTYDYETQNNEEVQITQSESITGGFKYHTTNATCNSPNLIYVENSYTTSILCTESGYEEDGLGGCKLSQAPMCSAGSGNIQGEIYSSYFYDYTYPSLGEDSTPHEYSDSKEITSGLGGISYTVEISCEDPSLDRISDDLISEDLICLDGYILTSSGLDCEKEVTSCPATTGTVNHNSFNYEYDLSSNLEKNEGPVFYDSSREISNGDEYYRISISCLSPPDVYPLFVEDSTYPYIQCDNNYELVGNSCEPIQADICEVDYDDGLISFTDTLQPGEDETYTTYDVIIQGGTIGLYQVSYECSNDIKLTFGEPNIEYVSCDNPGDTFDSKTNTCVPAEQLAFVSNWKIEDSDKTLTLPLKNDGEYDFTVDWGDGSSITNVDSHNSNYKSKTYTNPGIYKVIISGKINGFGFNNQGDKEKLINITSWGDLNLGNEGGYFYGAENLESLPDKVFNTTGTQDFSNMFNGAKKFNSPIINWDFSDATNMSNMFNGATSLNSQVTIDAPNAQDMSYMFNGATSLNSQVTIDAPNAQDMSYMFNGATSFDKDLNSWTLGSVENMSHMFNGATNFNGKMSSWDTESVLDMSYMFNGSKNFNQNINSWNTGNVEDMSYMFSNTDNFNQNLGDWDVSNVLDMKHMFSNKKTYDFDLSNWQPLKVTDMSYMFSGANAGTNLVLDWEISSVSDMSHMFSNNLGSITEISDWDTESVLDMSYMFNGATNFNQNLNWETRNVLDMSYMFNGATNFNGWVLWDTGNVNNMDYMFKGATNFNKNILNWNTENVKNMNYMFYDAQSFDQDLFNWNVNKVISCFNFNNSRNWNQNKPYFNQDCYEKFYQIKENTLIDVKLGLEWQRTNFSPDTMNYVPAASYCNNLIHSDYDDWRLPSLTEMELSIVDRSDGSPYIIGNYEYFPEIITSSYWTNTRYSSSRAYYVYFYDGISSYFDTSYSYYVLCVRNSN